MSKALFARNLPWFWGVLHTSLSILWITFRCWAHLSRNRDRRCQHIEICARKKQMRMTFVLGNPTIFCTPPLEYIFHYVKNILHLAAYTWFPLFYFFLKFICYAFTVVPNKYPSLPHNSITFCARDVNRGCKTRFCRKCTSKCALCATKLQCSEHFSV